MRRALLCLLITAAALGGGWGWLIAQLPSAGRAPAGVGGGLAVAVAAAAVAVAVYYAATARHSRERLRHVEASAALLERETWQLAEETLPELCRHLHNGATIPSAQAVLGQPSHPAAQRLLQSVAQALEQQRRARAAAAAACSAMEGELGRLADEQLPLLVKSLRAGEGVPDVALAEVMRPSQPAVQRLWARIARELEAGNRQGAAAMAACADAAARIQAQVTSLLGRLRELEDEYGDQEDIFAHLLDADHFVSQMGRLADNIALLSGGRSGRRWTKPIMTESVLRGAIGRIGAYRRVQLHSTSTAAVAGYAAEGVMHALAELIDNATKFSPHNTMVHVYVEEVDAGMVITIDDSGLGMRTRERRVAEQLISRPMDLTTLSGTRLGLAAVGRLAGKYGLEVNFRPSSRGGIGVVLLVPRQLIMYPQAEEPPVGQGLPELSGAGVARAGQEAGAPSPDGEQVALPKRPRGQTLLAASSADPVAPSGRPRDGAAAADRMAAFRQARDSQHGSQREPQHDPQGSSRRDPQRGPVASPPAGPPREEGR